MTLDLDVIAREAGFDVHDRKHQIRVGADALLGIDSTPTVRRFAALLLEKVAQEAEIEGVRGLVMSEEKKVAKWLRYMAAGMGE